MTSILKAGKYLIGDPCYFYDNTQWIDFCDRTTCLNDKDCGLFIKDQNNNEFWCMQTKHGDGAYPLYKGIREVTELGVDSGLLAIIPLEIACQWPKHEENKLHGHIIEIEEDCEITCNNGDIQFADYEILAQDKESENDDWPEDNL